MALLDHARLEHAHPLRRPRVPLAHPPTGVSMSVLQAAARRYHAQRVTAAMCAEHNNQAGDRNEASGASGLEALHHAFQRQTGSAAHHRAVAPCRGLYTNRDTAAAESGEGGIPVELGVNAVVSPDSRQFLK